jgi:hypothetical protein
MKNILAALVVAGSLFISASSFAATEKEKAFTDAYKKAFETKDEAALKGFLYTKGSDPTVLDFYTMMMTADMGGKITSIELRDLSTDDIKKANEMQPLPNGTNAKLTLSPTKKLVYKIETSDANGSSSSTSESFVAEHEGKFVIPVPGPVH